MFHQGGGIFSANQRHLNAPVLPVHIGVSWGMTSEYKWEPLFTAYWRQLDLLWQGSFLLLKHRNRLRLAMLEDLKILHLRPGTGSPLIMVTTISFTTSRRRVFSVGVGTTGGFWDWAEAAIAVLAKSRNVLRKDIWPFRP